MIAALGCHGKPPSHLGATDPQLAPCPATPNCVSSAAGDSLHRVAAFSLAVPAETAWAVVREVVTQMPRTVIITASDEYLHAEARSLIFRFTDDLELHLRKGDSIIAVRSASRVGRSDFGVNRKRVESIRASLMARGVIRE